MLKILLGDSKDGRLLLLGLTPENITRLQAGRPILIEGTKLGLSNVRIGLCYGETVNDIADEIRTTFGIDIPHIPDAAPGEEIVVTATQPRAEG